MAAVTIITKNNDSAGVVPSAGQLVKGELAVNVTDRRLYTLDAGNNVVLISSGADYIEPVTITVTDASPAVTVTQNGAGGSAVFINNGNGDAFRITNSGSGNSLIVEDSANPDSTPFVVTSTGKVVVGNTVGITTSALEVIGVDNATTREGLVRYSADTLSAGVLFSKSRSSSIGTQTVIQSGDSLGVVGFRGSDGTAFIPGAQIEALVDGTPGTNDMPTSLIFATTPDGTDAVVERIRIRPTGAVSFGSSGTGYGVSGQILVSQGDAPPAYQDQFVSITYIISSGGSTIATGIAGDLTIPFNCTITEWTLLADQVGSAVVDVWKDTYANYPPTVADTITGSAKPTITSAVKGQSSTLTGWTTTIASGDTLRFNVDSASLVTRLTISLKAKRT